MRYYAILNGMRCGAFPEFGALCTNEEKPHIRPIPAPHLFRSDGSWWVRTGHAAQQRPFTADKAQPPLDFGPEVIAWLFDERRGR